MDNIIVFILNAVKQDPMNPMWPAGCTKETIKNLINKGLLEYKELDIDIHGDGWSSEHKNISQHEYRLTRKGERYLEKSGQ